MFEAKLYRRFRTDLVAKDATYDPPTQIPSPCGRCDGACGNECLRLLTYFVISLFRSKGCPEAEIVVLRHL